LHYPLIVVDVGLAGKTTLSERLLLYSGSISAAGEVHDGTTTMDFLDQERERGITIKSAATSFSWNEALVNLIDTPGHVDFTVEVERSLRVLDGAVALYDAVHGVEAQSETVWRQADRYGVSRIAFANKMDREGASLERTMDGMRHRLGANPVALQLPLGEAKDFCGLVDLVRMEVVTFGGERGEEVVRYPILEAPSSLRKRFHAPGLPADVVEAAVAARSHMLEALGGADETLADAVLLSMDADSSGLPLGEVDLSIPGLSSEEVDSAVRRITISQCREGPKTVPVLCGSAYRNVGVQPLVDAIAAYLPSPLDSVLPTGREVKTGELITVEPSSSDPLCAFAFKVAAHPTRGPLVYVRVYSGSLGKVALLNTTQALTERPSKVLQLFADQDREVESIPAGHIGAIAGLRDTRTGDTLCAAGAPRAVKLPGLLIPEPVCTTTVEVDTVSEQKQLEEALHVLTRQDPSLRVKEDAETGQILLSGMGQLHLEVAAERLRREHKLEEVRLGKVHVAFREGVTGEGEATATYDRVLDGKRHWARVSVRVEPAGDHSADPPSEFEALAVSAGEEDTPVASLGPCKLQSLSKPMNEAFADALDSALGRGPVAGLPLIRTRVRLIPDRTWLSPLSTPVAIRAAVSRAVHSALIEASTALLEPTMRVEVLVPERHTGTVLNDLTSARRGSIVSVEASERSNNIVVAHVPFAALVGDYAGALRSITAGEASFSMELYSYNFVPSDVAKGITENQW
jgi:elongation factor G